MEIIRQPPLCQMGRKYQCIGTGNSLIPTLRLASNTFGKGNVAVLYGWIGAAHQSVASLAAMTAGSIRTYLGDYRVASWLSAVYACSPQF